MAHAFEILLRPLVTEKSTFLQETRNQYVFEVNPKANRVEIKKELEKVFPKIKVVDVRTAIVRGKLKRVGRHSGKRSNWKKAVITLREGDKLELFEGA